MATPDDATVETLTDVVRRIVSREIHFLDEKVAGLNDDDVKRLVSLALVLQRIRQPASKETDDPDVDPASKLTNEQLAKKAAQGE